MSEVLNPVDVERAITHCKDRIHNSVKVVSERFGILKAAIRAQDRAYAFAYLNADGPAHEKRYRAELDPTVVAARDARDAAEQAYEYADSLGWAVKDELKAWQSIGASVRSMYSGPQGFGG